MAESRIIGGICTPDGRVGLFIPDTMTYIPGFASLNEMIDNAQEYVKKSFEEWVEKNYTLPDKVMSNEVSGITRAYTVGHNIPVDGDVIFIAVSEPKINFKGVRIRLTLPKYIIEMIDSQASAQNISRSDVISQAIVHWCEYKNQDDEPEEEINNIDMF